MFEDILNHDKKIDFIEELETANPIHEDIDGWYFWNETWADRYGPYSSKEEAEAECIRYAEWLNGGTIV